VTLYVDSSALLKRYVDEHDSEAAVGLMATDPVLVTCRLTEGRSDPGPARHRLVTGGRASCPRADVSTGW